MEILNPEQERFVQSLTDPGSKELTWEFHIIGDLVIVSKVFNYVWTSHAIPITIGVIHDGVLVEIPWTSIQTIRLIK